MDARTRIASNLRRLRTGRRVSQEHLAVDASVDRTYISGIENGSFNPSIDILERLAKALSVDIAEFFEPLSTPVKAKGLTPGRKKSSD
ncbi:helix-turn-helix domain-containing protein [Pelagibacterium montanilacus]|uniref:helix-turn-helix domain-containing protein n=1 Tax=Pelagibacterium montanilacus TaxID=2185280 RepID=UPI000F8C5276|nr:helix-turn-helix transcriptional regulator [Pelagibacterium montanilacus]